MSSIIPENYENLPNDYRVSKKKLGENLPYIDKDDYSYADFKNKRVHKFVYSSLIILYLFVFSRIFRIYINSQRNNIEVPPIIYILFILFSILFYLYYYKISIILTDLFVIFYIPI